VKAGSYGSGGNSASRPPSPTPDDPALAVLGGVTDDLLGLVEREAANDVGRQPDLDAVQLARLLRPSQ
jgi:hypothetical protein